MSLKSFPKLEAFCRNRREKRPVQKARVDRDFLVRLHGIVKWNEKKGNWRGVSKAERKLNRSRMSIYDILALNPILRKKPKKIYPEYKDFWENPDIKKYQKMQTLQVRSLTTVNRRLGHLQEFWLVLDRTNPMNWDLDDYISLLQNLKFHDPNSILAQATPTKVVMDYQCLDSLRAWIMYSQPELFMKNKSIFTTKGHKRRSGRKLTWFLTPEEQAKLLEVIDDLTFLTYCILQLRTGSRFSGMMQIRANDVNFVART